MPIKKTNAFKYIYILAAVFIIGLFIYVAAFDPEVPVDTITKVIPNEQFDH